jgi:FKBP-type peptidyl-prolyl cis-trans isomerase
MPVLRLIRPRGAATVCAVLGAAVLSGCGTLVPVTTATPAPACSTPGPATEVDSFSESAPLTTTSDGLQYGDIRVGCGTQAKTGSTVAIEYTGWLNGGKEFDTSRAASRQAFEFIIGSGQVISGVDEGVIGMRVGGKRRLVIPPSLGFGDQGSPPTIPPNATLYFDVELVLVS